MLWTLIPAKSFHASKQRLARILSRDERARLSAAMLRRSIEVAKSALYGQPVWVVAGDSEVADLALNSGADHAAVVAANGLNGQLAAAAANVPACGDLLVIHGDLPLLQADDLRVLSASNGKVVIAPDRSMTGTNALLQRSASRFFHFGPDSCVRHGEAARRQGTEPVMLFRKGLAFDLDEPDDWFELPPERAEFLSRSGV